MKRYAVFAVLLLFVIGVAVAAYAVERHGSSRMTIHPSEMKDGETKTFTDDGRKITVRRQGDTTQVTIEGAEGTKTLSITNDGSDIYVDGSDSGRRRIVIGPDSPRIWVDGFKGDSFKQFQMPHSAQTWFVCPKDHTMMRVPEDKSDGTFKCPVDGTTMEKRKGRGFAFFFDDGDFETHDM